MKLQLLFFLFFCLFAYSSNAQAQIQRGFLQRMVISSEVIKPQFSKGPLKLTEGKPIDEFFALLEKIWAEAAGDSLKKYPSSFTTEEYKRLDAYTYLWALASIKQDVDAASTHTNQLLQLYMALALLRDLNMLERLRNLEAISQIDAGSLGNLLALGTRSTASHETQLATIAVYNKGAQLFYSLLAAKDTLISKAAANRLQLMKPYEYTIRANEAFYNNKSETVLHYLSMGLANHQFPHSKAIELSKKLVPVLLEKGKQKECIDLLHAIAQGASAENIDKEGLLDLYKQVDRDNAIQLYQDAIASLHQTTFSSTGFSISLPTTWNFLVNSLTPQRVAKAKYILLDFWYTSCGPCIREIPELNDFWKSISSRDDVVFISVNTDYINGNKNEDYVRSRSAGLNINFPVVYDNIQLKLGTQLEVASYPFKVIMDVKGNIIYPSDKAAISLTSFALFLNQLK